MEKQLLSALFFCTLLSCVASCNKDEVGTPSEQQVEKEKIDDDAYIAPVIEDIIVTVDAEGKADGDHRFVKIDEANYYIDDIRYKAVNGDLTVTGYNNAFFKGEAKIITQLNYDGRVLSVVSIENDAFKNCSVLTSVLIPKTINSIGYSAFNGCIGLTNVSINCANVKSWFSKNTSIKTVVLGQSVTDIGDCAFYGCSGITNIAIGEAVSSIGRDAFSFCSNIKFLRIPESTTNIDYYAFQCCSGEDKIIVSKNNKTFDSRGGCNAIIETSTNRLFVGCKNTVIPESVTSILLYAFQGCTGLTSIKIPESVTEIWPEAFMGCENLAFISVAANNPKYDSRNDCNAIIATKTNSLFLGCKNTVIPESVTSIDNYAFYDRKCLTTITIPESITSIGTRAFYGCSGLTSVEIGKSVKFFNDAFSYCSNLESIVIPESVRDMSSDAFLGCDKLKDVYYFARANTVSYNFTDNVVNMTLHVPSQYIDEFRNNRIWSRFGKIVPMDVPLAKDVDFLFDDNFTFTGITASDSYPYYTWAEPGFKEWWASANAGYRYLGIKAQPMDYPTAPEIRTGVDGKNCLKLTTRDTGSLGSMVAMRIVAGILFTGTFDSQMALKNSLAATHMGLPYAHKPIKMSGFYKYQSGEKMQDKYGNEIIGEDAPDIYCVVYRNVDAYGNPVQLDGSNILTSPAIVGIGRIKSNKIDYSNQWVYFELPIEYMVSVDNNDIKNNLYSTAIVFTSSIRGAEFVGAPGSTLWIDNVKLESEY